MVLRLWEERGRSLERRAGMELKMDSRSGSNCKI